MECQSRTKIMAEPLQGTECVIFQFVFYLPIIYEITYQHLPNYQYLQSDLMQAAGDYGSNGLGQSHTGCTERSAWDMMRICKAATCMGHPRATY